MNTKQQPTSKQKLSAYNQAVKEAYFKILKATKNLIASLDRHELRCTLQRSDRSQLGLMTKVHEIVNPVIYLCLECTDGESLSIHFGFELFSDECEYSHLTSKFIRLLYKLTGVEHTAINIEDCICTEYLITECSSLFEMIEDSEHKNHQFMLIPYKASPSKRKLMRVA